MDPAEICSCDHRRDSHSDGRYFCLKIVNGKACDCIGFVSEKLTELKRVSRLQNPWTDRKRRVETVGVDTDLGTVKVPSSSPGPTPAATTEPYVKSDFEIANGVEYCHRCRIRFLDYFAKDGICGECQKEELQQRRNKPPLPKTIEPKPTGHTQECEDSSGNVCICGKTPPEPIKKVGLDLWT